MVRGGKSYEFVIAEFPIFSLLLSLGSLQITNSQETDQGKFECVAENSKGTEYSYATQLYVRGEQQKS